MTVSASPSSTTATGETPDASPTRVTTIQVEEEVAEKLKLIKSFNGGSSINDVIVKLLENFADVEHQYNRLWRFKRSWPYMCGCGQRFTNHESLWRHMKREGHTLADKKEVAV